MGSFTSSACQPHCGVSIYQAHLDGQPRRSCVVNAMVSWEGAPSAASADCPYLCHLHIGIEGLVRRGRGGWWWADQGGRGPSRRIPRAGGACKRCWVGSPDALLEQDRE